MSSIQKFKKLARLRLREGRLIKLENEFEIDKTKVKPINNRIENIILNNLVYISFDNFVYMLFKGFEKFLQHINGEPYTLMFKQDRNKSDVWVICLLLRYGRQFIGRTYYDPNDIINLTSEQINPDKQVNYVLVDDFIFTGTQMTYSIEHFDLKLNYNARDYKKHVVCGGIGPEGLNKLSSRGVTVFYGKEYASLGQLVKMSEYRTNYAQYRSELSKKFGQPFIDPIDYMNNIPIYFEHKIPDVMSSFPHIIIQVAKNCIWDENTDINDGSSQHTPCGKPFYKTVNDTKGKVDQMKEKQFMKRLVQKYRKQIN